MGFIHHDKVPGDIANRISLASGKLIRADDNPARLEGVYDPGLGGLPEGLGFENFGCQVKFIGQLLMPLLSQIGWDDDQNPALAFGPALRNEESSFNGFP